MVSSMELGDNNQISKALEDLRNQLKDKESKIRDYESIKYKDDEMIHR
eukprot:CAMPEP_0116936618 /NCGR_PEP_ID=MMETSP0467-20121206/30998_1 /TAXON_ID=283647 /ORGANISM="Mesodinium pulex, Strain SPMC105" /LENGTH=47 /DNA_ID= /DNA_START= /DNA_END= /DNA_ORIENTATION=